MTVMEQTKYLIAGSSHAALSALNSIRMLDLDSSLTLITKDERLPYSPTVLPYIVSGKSKPEKVQLRDDAFFAKNKVNFISGAGLSSLDADNSKVTLQDGQEWQYEKLLLATGASPTIPTIPGLMGTSFYVLRTMDDAVNLNAALNNVKSAVVLGGGLIGMHAAENLIKAGVQVTIIEMRPQVLPGYFDQQAAKIIEKIFADIGVTMRIGDTVIGAAQEEICDADLKINFGDDRGLEWFKKEGVVTWPKTPQEVYWRAFTDARVPIYWEWMPELREKIQAISGPAGLDVPKDYYSALAEFLPCQSHECKKEGFDFYTFYYRDTLHTNSFTMENAWLDEAAQLDPYSYNIAMNTDSGRARGLVDGDVIELESEKGRKVTGRVHLTEAIHPEGLGMAALCGHWAKGMPMAKGKGVFYNELLELDWESVNPVNLTLDLCSKVKVTRVEEN